MNASKVQSIKKYANQTQNFRLALDLGTNSIGWALYELDRDKKPKSILKTGVRIFSSGRKHKYNTTLNATRREKRLQRRQRDRYLQRRRYLLGLLKKHELFPKDDISSKKLKNLNPYELRAKGLDEKLDLSHFGRSLFHINQKRGFKSNRKSDGDKETGPIKKSITAAEKLMREHDSKTYGEFLWKRFKKMEESRKTPGSQEQHWVLARRPVGFSSKDSYAVYADRDMIKEEFNKLWDKQSEFHEKLKNENLKKKFFKAVFFQRPLKKPIVGKCELIPNEDRISKALPSFQKFRILKELNNLEYIDDIGKTHPIAQLERGLEFRNKIIEECFLKKAKVTFKALEKEFKNFFPDINNFSNFNLDTYNRDDLEGEKTAYILKKIIPNWLEWSLEDQDRFIELLEGENITDQFIKDDEEVLEDLKKFNKDKKLSLSQEKIKECLKKENKLPSGHGKYSKKAVKKILPFLEKGNLEHEAVKLSGLGHHSDRKYKGELAHQLPVYQDVLKEHCVEMSLEPDKEKPYKTFRISNPTVHIAFNQLRLVVNDIIRLYGKPSQIVIETARDLPMGKKTKDEHNKKQKENKKRNDEAREAIKEFNIKDNRDNLVRFKLWKEQDHTCIYSGKKISQAKFYTAELEIDHILPYSKTLDDGYMNKVLVYKSSNQNKSDKTPYEFFSSDTETWTNILDRAKDLPKNKHWRFNSNAMEKFLGEGDFLARQLNDTRYISKYSKKYLSCICPDIWTVRGQTVSLIRPLVQFEKKDRMDHRHHAKDALAIGLIDRSLVKKISDIAKKEEGLGKKKFESIRKAIQKNILPWDSFKEDAKKSINKIIVSHKKSTKKTGQLHNATAYGLSSSKIKDFSNPVEVIHYVDIMKLAETKTKDKKIDKILSSKIKKDFEEEKKRNNKITKEFLKNYHKQTGVRRVRLKEKMTVIPIKNKLGKIYKTFNPDSNYAVELFINSTGGWDDSKVITTFEANQKGFVDVKDDSKIMKDDILFFENEFWRLVKFDRNKNLTFTKHFASGNPDDLKKDKETKSLVRQKIINSLKKLNPKKVYISPAGKWKKVDFNLRKSAPKQKVI